VEAGCGGVYCQFNGSQWCWCCTEFHITATTTCYGQLQDWDAGTQCCKDPGCCPYACGL
jgi:hypothetical protein